MYRNFNPRAPCGARPCATRVSFNCSIFQSTRPVWGATTMIVCQRMVDGFQSTRPVWGATITAKRLQQRRGISIHAPRVGRDLSVQLVFHQPMQNFNPRAPCGARHASFQTTVVLVIFQSTRPVWGATDNRHISAGIIDISIHAPRVGRDQLRAATAVYTVRFQSTRPV